MIRQPQCEHELLLGGGFDRSFGGNFMRVTAQWLLAVLGLLLVQTASAATNHWVTTWGCAPQLTEPGNLPPRPLAHSTLRQFVRSSVGGTQMRVRFSNAFGTNDVNINAAHVALAAGAGSAGAGDIHVATDKPLKFRGVSNVVISPGEAVLSDPLEFELPALRNVAVSIYFGDMSATTINGHPGARTTSFLQPSNALSEASLPMARQTKHWYILTGLEVLAAKTSRAVVVLGDSITDGRGSTDDGQNRWPDVLAQRLNTNAATANVAVVNMGIGGNAIFGGLGPAAIKRFERDVLEQSGARYLIVFEGVNDLGGASAAQVPALTTRLINAYTEFATKAKAHGMRAYGVTITPFGGNGYYTEARETARQTINSWFRTNTVFDGVIDFDAAVRDPVTLTNFQAAFYRGLNANDWLHLNPAGYRVMAEAVDLNLFTK